LATHLSVPVASDAARRDPAPGDLELIRQFVNTYDVEDAWEGLTTPAELGIWFAERGLLPGKRPLTDDDLATAITLREALREVLSANAGHATAGDVAAAHRTLDRLASHYPMRVRLDGDAHLEPSVGTGISPAIAGLLATIYDAMTVGTWPRLKVCRNDECQWAFYDHSRNRSGAWCRMAICGNRMKGRAFRARQAHAAGGQTAGA
jgi:predicted RNA-binding Zn ribbon-like protein